MGSRDTRGALGFLWAEDLRSKWVVSAIVHAANQSNRRSTASVDLFLRTKTAALMPHGGEAY